MLTKQEMFNRAWVGLASQGWEKAIDRTGCSYLTPDGKRCAWGWVDPEGTCYTDETGTWPRGGNVVSLRDQGYGLAATLTDDFADFALSLQRAHDNSADPAEMRRRMLSVASARGLAVPETCD